MPKKIIVANWKMNGTIDKVLNDLSTYADLDDQLVNQIILSIPFPYLELSASIISECNNVHLASQDVSKYFGAGAYTGEVSANMLSDLGVSHGIIGHSERRVHLNEMDDALSAKLTNLINAGITPIFCVGESLEVRQSGDYNIFIINQLKVLSSIDFGKCKSFIIAYEPIWSIGSGIVPTSLQIKEMMNNIQTYLQSNVACDKIHALYGGSVTSSNIKEILSIDKVDGVLVGGASLKVADFLAISLI